MNKSMAVCTLEMYIEGAYRYYALKHIRSLPTVGDIFMIAIDMWQSQGLYSSNIWCNSIGAEIKIKDIQLEDVKCILDCKRMAHITEYDGVVCYESQNELLHNFA